MIYFFTLLGVLGGVTAWALLLRTKVRKLNSEVAGLHGVIGNQKASLEKLLGQIAKRNLEEKKRDAEVLKLRLLKQNISEDDIKEIISEVDDL